MKYSALIRKLVKASEEANWRNVDVADILKERCVMDIDIIRQTLMSCVCDPRFRMHVCKVPQWSILARRKLETFAKHLESIDGLNDGLAILEMNEMLSEWFDEVLTLVERKAEGKLHFCSIKESEAHTTYTDESIENALEDFVNGEKIENESDPLSLLWSGEQTHDSLGMLSDGKSEEEPDKNSDNDEDGNVFDTDNMAVHESGEEEGKNEDDEQEQSEQIKRNHKGIAGGAGYDRKLEDRFFANVPPSLIQLAREIGRADNACEKPSGNFVSASKSDIAGITTGNELSCVLPSELALMADPFTENIFYKNYVTKNLQLFASKSTSGNSKKHHDGPVIICLDTSGSMRGEPVIVAKALTFAVCIIAQRTQRKVIVIKYSESHKHIFLSNIGNQRKELMDFLSVAEEGGNNEDELFRWIFTDILPGQEEYENGDILCISDFGWMPISPEVMKLIQESKQKNMKFFGLCIGGDDLVGYTRTVFDEAKAGQPSDVIDSLWEYCNNRCVETKFHLDPNNLLRIK